MKNILLALLCSVPSTAFASTLECTVEKVGQTDSRLSQDCGKFVFALPHDTETKHGTGACAGLELDSHYFEAKNGHHPVQFVVSPSIEERGPNGNSGYAWVGFQDVYPSAFALQAIGERSNYVVRCKVVN